jgi:hypothetical protein
MIGNQRVGFEANTTPWENMSIEQYTRKIGQVTADLALVKEGKVDRVIWFGTNLLPTVGLGGELIKVLEQSGIEYWHVPWK